MIVGIPKESYPGERRVALVPKTVPNLVKAGLQVVLEAGAGTEAGYPDAQYAERDVKILPDRASVFATADIVLQVLCYGSNDLTGKDDLPLLRRGQALIGFLRPLGSVEVLQEIASTGVTSFAVELMPRTTRAQSMDALSSMATICGYKAVLIAADTLPRMFPMFTTAAGTITPARVLVIGAGVAGLQAIATARRLGAVASAYDLRPAVKEQVQSLGGRFVELPVEAKDAEDAGGYARPQDETFYARQRELLGQVVAESDVVITAAVIPGKRSPILVTTEMVKSMAPGSVIVDLAAERGGNCELTRKGETVVEHGVTIIGRINYASGTPYHASQMYARNLTTFLLHLVKDGELRLNLQDQIVRETLLTHEGEIVNERVRQFFALPSLTPREPASREGPST
ncbi:MAG TPA: Re/Si-specific NAD(P)(+) transhydrogenase subunit alpha [Candidatus Binatia bacterium]|nr:Re/Si-specific NAD(P)(+) transhydrogenase subunit alpha [Candidatus Binatia bacterium]